MKRTLLSLKRFIRKIKKIQLTRTGRYFVMLMFFFCTFLITLVLGHKREKEYESFVPITVPTETIIEEETHPKKKEPAISELARAEMKLTLREREDLVYEMLISEGFSPEGACGIMGNMSVENENFDPTIEANNGITYGLFQWNDVGERRTNLVHYCNDNHIHYDTIEGQVSFAIFEIRGGDSIAKRLRDYLETTNDTYTAAMEFTAGFERCVASKDLGQGKYTASLYPEFRNKPYQSLKKRISRALNYANRYVGDDSYSNNE